MAYPTIERVDYKSKKVVVKIEREFWEVNFDQFIQLQETEGMIYSTAFGQSVKSIGTRIS